MQSSEAPAGSSEVTVHLLLEDEKQAEASFLLKEFFTTGFAGECENWILLNDVQGVDERKQEYTQVKLWMSLQPAPRPKAPVKRSAARSLSSGGLGLLPQACPFLGKVESAARQDREGKG